MASAKSCCFLPLPDTEILLPGTSFSGAREMYCRRVYFAEPSVQLHSDDVVIDLGANQGLFSLLASKVASRVISVEAQSEMHKQFLQPRLGHAANVTLVHGLIAAESGVFASQQSRREASHWREEPASVSLENLLLKYSIDRIGFLKCDIEGSEFSLFNRSHGWIDIVERIAMECHPDHGEIDELVHTLQSAGFKLRYRSPDLIPCSVSTLAKKSGYLYAFREVT